MDRLVTAVNEDRGWWHKDAKGALKDMLRHPEAKVAVDEERESSSGP